MKSVLLVVMVIMMLATQSAAIESKIRFRLYRKTLHELLEKNGPFISEYTSTSLGSVDVADIAMKDSTLSVKPQSGTYDDFEADLKFVEGEGAELSFNEFQFELDGKVEDKDASLTGNIDKIFIKFSIKGKEGAEKVTGSESFEVSALPEFNIEKIDVDFEKESIKWIIDGEEKQEEGLAEKTVDWLNQAIEGQMLVLKYILNVSQQKLAEYIKQNVDMNNYKGKLSFSAISFYEDYVEMGVITSFETQEGEYKIRETDTLAREAGDDMNAVEIVFDENIINTGLYAAFHSDSDFSLRSILRADDPENEYSQMFAGILKTQVVGQAWKEIEKEFGSDKR